MKHNASSQAQNHLNKIIAESTNNMRLFTDTIKYVVSNCKSLDIRAINHSILVIDKFKPIINSVAGCATTFASIVKNVKPATIMYVTDILRRMRHILLELDSLSMLCSSLVSLKTQKTIIKSLKGLDTIMQLVTKIVNVKPPGFISTKIKLWILKSVMKKVYSTVKSVTKNIFKLKDLLQNATILAAIYVSKFMLQMFQEIKKIMEAMNLFGIKFWITSHFKLKGVKSFIKKILDIFIEISDDIQKKLQGLLGILLSLVTLKYIFIKFDELMFIIKSLLTWKRMFWLWWNGKKYIKRIKKVVDYINQIMDEINEIKKTKINDLFYTILTFIKIEATLKMFKRIIPVFLSISKAIPLLFHVWHFPIISKFILAAKKILNHIFDLVTEAKKELGGQKWKSFSGILKRIVEVFELVKKIAKSIITGTIYLLVALGVVKLYSKFFSKVVTSINSIIKRIDKISFKTKPIGKLKKVLTLLALIKSISLAFIIGAVILTVALPAMIIFLVVAGIMIGIIKLVIKLINRMKFPPRTLINLLIFAAVLTLLGIICLYIVTLTTHAPLIFEGILVLSGIILGLLLVVASLALFGLAIKVATPILIPALIGIGLILVVVLAIAAIFHTLESINFEKIRSIIDEILLTAKDLVNSVFKTFIDPAESPNNNKNNNKNEEESWYMPILKAIGGVVATLAGIIVSNMILCMTLTSVFFLLLIAGSLRIIQSIDLQDALILKKVNTVLFVADMVAKTVYKRPKNPLEQENGEKKEEEKSWIDACIDWVDDALYAILNPIRSVMGAILSVAYLANTLTSVVIIFLIAMCLRAIQSIDLKDTTILTKVTNILDCATAVATCIHSDTKGYKPTGASGFIRKILEVILPSGLLNILDAIASIGRLALAWIAVWILSEIAGHLNSIQNITLKEDLVTKASSILTKSDEVVGKVLEKMKGASINQIRRVSHYLGALKDSMGALVEINNVISKGKYVRQALVSSFNNTTSIIAATMKSIENIKANNPNIQKRIDIFEDLYDVIEDFCDLSSEDIKNSEVITKNYISLLDKIGTTDIEKLKTTTSLFEKMAEFSKSINGNFEGLADALNEKIAPLLEKLQNGIDGLKTSVVQSGANVSSSVYAAAQGPLSMEAMKRQVGAENPYASEKDKNDIAMRRMQEQMANQHNGLISKVDELIELFRNGVMKVTID